jgi:hypothetical protein
MAGTNLGPALVGRGLPSDSTELVEVLNTWASTNCQFVMGEVCLKNEKETRP